MMKKQRYIVRVNPITGEVAEVVGPATPASQAEMTAPSLGLRGRIVDIERLDVGDWVEGKVATGQRVVGVVTDDRVDTYFDYLVSGKVDDAGNLIQGLQVSAETAKRVFRVIDLSQDVECGMGAAKIPARSRFFLSEDDRRAAPASRTLDPQSLAVTIRCTGGHNHEVHFPGDFTFDVDATWPDSAVRLARLIPNAP